MSGLLASELLKLRTTRAPYGLLLAIVAISALAVAGAVGADVLDGDDRALQLADAAEVSGLLVALLGILLVTNEYRHGTITPTFLVTPARERVVAAKLVAAALAGALAGVAVTAVALAIALPWLSSRGEALPVDADLATAVLRLVGAFSLWGVLGAAIGAVIRSQIGAVALTFAWFLIVEGIALAIDAVLFDGDDVVAPYLPGSAMDALVSTGGDRLVDPVVAVPLALLYTAALAALGLFLTLHRDAS